MTWQSLIILEKWVEGIILQVNSSRRVRLAILLPSVSWKYGALRSHNTMGLNGLLERKHYFLLWHIPKTTRVQLLKDSPASLNASHVYVPESSGKISAIFSLYMLASFVYWKSLLGLISLLLWSQITSNFWAPTKQKNRFVIKHI